MLPSRVSDMEGTASLCGRSLTLPFILRSRIGRASMSVAIWAAYLLLTTASASQERQSDSDSVSDEAFATSSAEWNGYVEFARLTQSYVGAKRVMIKTHINYSELTKNDAVIIVHPTEQLDESSLGAFLVDGGRLAILDDYGRGSEFLRNFGIVSRPAPPDPAEKIRNNPHLAVAVPSIQTTEDARRGRHPMTAGLEHVITNHPTVYDHPELTPVLEIVDKMGGAHALAVTGVIAQKGRLFALGDPSIFINLMLRYPDNRKLADGLIRYLVDDSSLAKVSGTTTPVQGRLYLLSNGFKQEGSYGNNQNIKDKIEAVLNGSADVLRGFNDDGLSREASVILCCLIIAGVFAHMRQTLQFPRSPVPSYSRAVHPAAQIGAASRIDVLKSTHAEPALLLLELDAVLRDAVSRRLHEDGGATPAQIAKSAQTRGLTPTAAAELEQLLTEFQRYAGELGRRRPKKVSGHQLDRFHEQTLSLLRAIEENLVSG